MGSSPISLASPIWYNLHMGLLHIEHPEILKDLAPGQDETRLLKLTSGSGVDLEWVCDKHGVYIRSVRHKVYGRGCRVCDGSLPEVGVSDFFTIHPHLKDFWDDNKNTVDPQSLFPVSKKQCWWKCPKGHSWEQNPREMSKRKTICLICNDEYIKANFTDKGLTQYPLSPEIAATYHPTKNTLPVEAIPRSSREKVWWKCENGHEWQSTPHNRSIGRGCGVCSGRHVLSGTNDLATTNPLVASWWSPKNVLRPESVTAGSDKRVMWVCDKGHEWESRVQEIATKCGDGKRTTPPCPQCTNRRVVAGDNDALTAYPHLAKEFVSSLNGKQLHEITAGSDTMVTWCCQNGHTWSARICDRTSKGYGCSKCSSSAGETEVASFIESLGVTIERHNRSLIAPQEIDIYIPKHKIAVEFNGVYWHSEYFRTQDYHARKTQRCEDAGVQLIHVWEDDWQYRQDIVKEFLRTKLGCSQRTRVGARKCAPTKVSREEAHTFLELNHIQGSVNATHYCGLRYNDELVAVMTLKSVADGNVVLSRYATSAVVQGGFSRLLKWVESWLEYNNLITYADKSISDGGLYERQGFELTHTIGPDYTYLYNGQRRHKFGFRKEKFQKSPALGFREGLTERELAKLNGIPRVYDCGKKVYSKPHPRNNS